MNIFQKHRSNLFSLRAKIKTLALSAVVGCSVLSASQAQAQNVHFDTAQVNPFGLSSLAPLYGINSTFADLDNDGDMDMLVGSNNLNTYIGDFRYYENTGSASAPVFAAPINNPFGLVAQFVGVFPEFVDLDNDGDMDILVGVYTGDFKYFENIGSASAPAFAASQTNPFGISRATSGIGFASFADLNNDGDLDLLFNDFSGNWSYQENTGTASAPAFASRQTNPFGLSTVMGTYGASSAFPAFNDMDNDGDMDIMFGSLDSVFHYLPNVGTATAPSFGSEMLSPFGLMQEDSEVLTPSFVDLDGDGDMDMLAGSNNGDFYYYENINCPRLSPLTTQNDTLYAHNYGAAFRWYNCGDTTLLATTVDPYYTPNRSGNFYAVVDNGLCVDSTACLSFIFSSVADETTSKLLIYPNPTNGLLNVEIPAELQDAELRVISVSGQAVFNQSNVQAGLLGLNMSALPAGLYTVEIKNSKLVARQKFNKF